MAYFIEEDEWAEDWWSEDDFTDHSRSMEHYGVKRKSGRYGWGTGKIPYQHEPWFTWGSDNLYNRVEDFRRHYKAENGKSPDNTTIARGLGMTRTEFDRQYPAAKDADRLQKHLFVKKAMDGQIVKGKHMSYHDIELYTAAFSKKHYGDDRFRIPENTARSLMDEIRLARTQAAQSTANFLKAQVAEKGMIDIGSGVELYMPGVSRTKLDTAIDILKQEGYEVRGRMIDQVTNPKSNNKTNIQVLCPPGTPKNILYTNLGDVKSIADYHAETSEDGTVKFWKMEYPSSMDSKRIQVRYGDETGPDGYTGKDRDGWIFLRRGVADLDLKDSLYAQVRILVDDTHYIKGMASYYDGPMPDGVDVIFNTNKPKGTPLTDPDPKAAQVLKPISHDDPINPFGALIKAGTGQYHYQDANGEYKLGLINKKSEEGDWGDWRKSVSAQFTSKQNEGLIKSQIDISLADKKAELESIKQLENVVLKKQLLMKFAGSCDSDAVDLRTGPMPGQSFQVLVPIPTLGDKECYAPQYETGTQVAVIRYPHADISEIPKLTVNNKNKEGLELLGKYAKDCIGLSGKAEAQLSGADNDGDAVMVIPIRPNTPRISAREPLKDMLGFDPSVEYPYHAGMKEMTKKSTQRHMGEITNLIMDMGLKGASDSEKARAIKYSMVVIDAAKHRYDWQLAYKDLGIQELKEKWQRHYDSEGNLDKVGGASTLLTRAKSPRHIPKREGQPSVDKETGELVYKTAKDEKLYWTNYKTGKVNTYTESVPAMSLESDARALYSDPKNPNPKEILYANYANSLKSLANEARKLAAHGLEKYEYSKEAAEKYKDEVDSLLGKINLSLRNQPRERMAQIQANAKRDKLVEENPELKGRDSEAKKKRKKIAQQAIVESRGEYNAKRVPIDVTPEEWEAISNHALDQTSLQAIFKYADSKQIREYAMPKKDSRAFTNAQISRIKNYAKAGWTYAEIAAKLGISKSSVEKYVNGGK